DVHTDELGTGVSHAHSDAAADIGAGAGDEGDFVLQLHWESRSGALSALARRARGHHYGRKVAKHLFELKRYVSTQAVSVGLRPNSAMAPARHIQLSSSCRPLSSIADRGVGRKVA